MSLVVAPQRCAARMPRRRRFRQPGTAPSAAPGKVAELVDYAERLGEADFSSGPDGANPFAELRESDGIQVTGSAHSWMTDEARLAPGGNYVRVPDDHRGGLGGNRFFTLRELR